MNRILPPNRKADERGATAVIVALTLVALLGLMVLTVDVGQLLFKRRAMVNASDAAALAAAQSCANIGDTDVPGTVANLYATQNVSSAAGGITELVGCDGPAFGHVSVEYGMNQSLFFAGVLGFNGPARVATTATAGWGPTGGGNPVPIVVYEGTTQGGCDIRENIPAGEQCYMWYDNDLFNESSFGFLNLCTASDPCQQGWDVPAASTCPSVGSSLRDDWINGTWQGESNETNYPAPTYVCRVTGLATDDWGTLDDRVGDELLFPVNDCTTQVDRNGVALGCTPSVAPDKYNIIGFIVLHLDAVYDTAREWGGTSYTLCQRSNVAVTRNQVLPLSALSGGNCPNGTMPSGIENLLVNGQAPGTPGAPFTYDPATQSIRWLRANAQIDIEFNWWVNGECGPPPGNSSAVCLKVTTVQARFRGTAVCESCKDFGARAVMLCDLAIGSCPQGRS